MNTHTYRYIHTRMQKAIESGVVKKEDVKEAYQHRHHSCIHIYMHTHTHTHIQTAIESGIVKKEDVEEAYRLRENTKYFLIDEFHRKKNGGRRDATATATETFTKLGSKGTEGVVMRSKCSIVQEDDVLVDSEIAPGGSAVIRGFSREDVERAREVVLAQIQAWHKYVVCVYVCIYVCIYIRACMFVCMCVYICVCVCIYIYIYIYITTRMYCDKAGASLS